MAMEWAYDKLTEGRSWPRHGFLSGKWRFQPQHKKGLQQGWETVGNPLVSSRWVKAHFTHLCIPSGVQQWLRL